MRFKQLQKYTFHDLLQNYGGKVIAYERHKEVQNLIKNPLVFFLTFANFVYWYLILR